MRFSGDQRTIALTAESIDEYSEHLSDVLGELGLERRNVLLARVTI